MGSVHVLPRTVLDIDRNADPICRGDLVHNVNLLLYGYVRGLYSPGVLKVQVDDNGVRVWLTGDCIVIPL